MATGECFSAIQTEVIMLVRRSWRTHLIRVGGDAQRCLMTW